MYRDPTLGTTSPAFSPSCLVLPPADRETFHWPQALGPLSNDRTATLCVLPGGLAVQVFTLRGLGAALLCEALFPRILTGM
jgi:hypothetical protein